LTKVGKKELDRWTTDPVTIPHVRDELHLKMLIAMSTDLTACRELITRQRQSALGLLANLTRTEEHGGIPELLREAASFRTEAELRWLDHCEDELMRRLHV
jgi:Virulence activator alpha C-term